MTSGQLEKSAPQGYLADGDRAYLHGCSITDEVIDTRPYLTLTDTVRDQLVERWGFHPAQVRPEGILVPRYDAATGEETYPQVRYRVPQPDPTGELHKHCSPQVSGGVVDAHPLIREEVLDGRRDLWVAESVKGADAIVSHGGVAVGIVGVGGFSVSGRMAEAFDAIPLRGRTVKVAFDADVRDPEKRGPLMMLGRFCYYLAWARGARVYVAEIPFEEATGKKQGIDDVLSEGG